MKGRVGLVLALVVALALNSVAVANAEPTVGTEVFVDMPDDWSTEALVKAVNNSLLSGYDEGEIRLLKPGNYLTRVEMATIVNRAFGVTEAADLAGVVDVAASQWHASEMARAVHMGTFVLDTRMRPDDLITRQEAFVVLSRAFKLASSDVSYRALDRFQDKGSIAGWALGGLDGMAAAGYIQGSAGQIYPTSNITRAEFAVGMDNLVKQYIDSPGTVSGAMALGNILIRSAGVTLKDVTVNGDLIIADGVGDGEVILDNVKVEGRVVARGGGTHSIIIRGGSQLGTVVVARVDGEIKILAEDGSQVEAIYVDDGSDDVIVQGTVGSIEIEASGVTVKLVRAQTGTVKLVGQNSTLVIDRRSTVGTIDVFEAASDTTLQVEGTVDLVTTRAPRTAVTGKGKVTKVEVQTGGSDAAIETPRTRIEVAEGVTGVTGGGGAPIEGGITVRNNDDGTDVIAPPPLSGGGGGGGIIGPTPEPVKGIGLSGDPAVGKTLLAIGLDPLNATVGYQWERAGSEKGPYEDIHGAVGRIYTLSVADEGKWIRVRVTGTGSYSGTAASAPLKVAIAPEERPDAISNVLKTIIDVSD